MPKSKIKKLNQNLNTGKTPKKKKNTPGSPLSVEPDIKETKKKTESPKILSQKRGCNCPTGCLEGSAIPAGCRILPRNSVYVPCSNEQCPAVPWLHGKCYEKWEKHLINDLMRSNQGICRSWSKPQCETFLWLDTGYGQVYKACACSWCSGYLRREIQNEKAAVVPATPVQSARPSHGQRPNDGGGWQTVGRNHRNQKPHISKQKSSNLPELADYKRPTGWVYKNLPGWKGDAWWANNAILQRDKTVPQHDVEAKQRRHTETRAASTPFEEFGAPSTEFGQWESSWIPTGDEDDSFLISTASADGERLINKLEAIVKLWPDKKIYTEHPVILDAISAVSVELMEEIVDLGGLDVWLRKYSVVLTVKNGRIVMKGVSAPHELRGLGLVRRVANDWGTEGIIFCESYQCHAFFDSKTELDDGCLLLGDLVSFLAEEQEESFGGCKWRATEVSVLQHDQEKGTEPIVSQLSPTSIRPVPNPVDKDSDWNEAERTENFFKNAISVRPLTHPLNEPIGRNRPAVEDWDWDDEERTNERKSLRENIQNSKPQSATQHTE